MNRARRHRAGRGIGPDRTGFTGDAGADAIWFSAFQHVDVQVDPLSVGELFAL